MLHGLHGAHGDHGLHRTKPVRTLSPRKAGAEVGAQEAPQHQESRQIHSMRAMVASSQAHESEGWINQTRYDFVPLHIADE